MSFHESELVEETLHEKGSPPIPILWFPDLFYKCRANQSNQQTTALIEIIFSFPKLPKFVSVGLGIHPQRSQRDYFTREAPYRVYDKGFWRHSLHETVCNLCLGKTRHGSYVTFMPVESSEMSIPCKSQDLFLV